MKATVAQPARFLEWDSTFFARRIAAVLNAPMGTADVPEVLAWCREARIECLYVLTDADEVPTLHALEEAGGRNVDIRLTFDCNPTKATHAVGKSIRPHREADVGPLRAIAAASHSSSRFYADGHFPRARCNELYATWVEKSCRGWAEQVFVADVDGQPSGYLSCHDRGGRRGEIGIVGVASQTQGRGLGRELVATALAWFAERGIERVTVVTQGRNIVAQRLYQSMGFRSAQVQLWHHLWFDVDGARA